MYDKIHYKLKKKKERKKKKHGCNSFKKKKKKIFQKIINKFTELWNLKYAFLQI